MNSHRLLLTALSFILFHSNVFASTDNAETRLKTAVNQIAAVANHASNRDALRVGVRPILQNNLNFETMTRRAIGPGWRQFTHDQQVQAVDLFTTLIIRTYTSNFTPGVFPAITFKPASSPASGRVEVPTTSVYKGSHYDVVYRLEAADEWRITDILIEGVSLIANYRAQFDAEFQQGGAKAVINSLNRSVSTPDQ
jgi:phospholipid transport system substrate-binding protein